jgi:serine/threonine protein kinase
MSDSRANPPQNEPPPPVPESPRAESATSDNARPALPSAFANVEATDNAPTVISRAAPKPATADDVFAGGLLGKQLAHYELIEPIGVGGMAAVLRARDTQLDRLVALKILPPETAADPENIRRFHQEARSAAKLDHETIARVFFCGEDQGLHFIAFEYVEGENLRAVIDKRGRLSAAEGIDYMLQIAGGLAHAASRAVVHRDIKPSNIIITPAGRAKLVDMGLARSLERSPDDGLTQSGVTLGTFDYISPEQALDPREADARSDIYSLGCTFYHALTGQAPVPEGTAAKKLHHHHHVKPVDPRQLAPNLPDVVAGILGRMMAKRPVDRYQAPEELAHDLVSAARDLGVTTKLPDMPPPVAIRQSSSIAGRPLLLAGVVGLVVVALIVFLDPGGVSSRPVVLPTLPETKEVGGKKLADAAEPEREKSSKPSPLLTKAARPTVVRAVFKGLANAENLAQWLADAKASGATELEIPLAGDLTLAADDPKYPCPILEASKVVVRPAVAGQRPTIRLSHHSPQTQLQPWAALTISGDNVSVEGIRFVVDASGGNYEMMALHLLGKGRYRVKDCEFVQIAPSFDAVKRLSSVRAEAAGGRSVLHLEECCFLGYMGMEEVSRPGMGQPASLQPLRVERGGQDAVVRRGLVHLEAVNCAFGPHAAAFRFEGAPAVADEGRADIRHCSVLAGSDSAVFDVAERASVELHVEACLFSRPPDAGGGMGTATRSAVLLRQSPPVASTPAVYLGKNNRYHNLDNAWVPADGSPPVDWNDFPRRLEVVSGSDVRSRILEESPWRAAQPLKLLEQPAPASPSDAFWPNEQLSDLHLVGTGGRATVAGIERIGGEDFAASLEQPDRDKPVLAANERLVDPAADENPARRIYNRLEDAINASVPRDVILIRHQDRLPVGPVRLERRADLTIRPALGFRPKLVPSETSGTTSLFTLRDGSLHLEGLDFRLQPGDDTRSLSLVALAGTGQCTLKSCVVTFDPASSAVPLALATVLDSVGVAEGQPQLTLDGCFIRGDGDVVRDRPGAPFDLKARNTLAVLNGSFLNVESAGDAVPAGQTVRASFSNVWTYLRDHLVRLQSDKEQRGLIPVQCEARDCLFVAAAGKSLVHLDGAEMGEERIRERLSWTGEGNTYASLKDRMFDQGTSGEEMSMSGTTMGADRWKSLFKEDGRYLPLVQFAGAPGLERPFYLVEPPQMRPVAPSLKEIGTGPNVPMPVSSDH